MQIFQKSLFVAALLFVGGCAGTGEKHSPDESLEISEVNGSYHLSVPVSRLTDHALGMNVQALAAGTYIVSVESGSKRLTERLVVAR